MPGLRVCLDCPRLTREERCPDHRREKRHHERRYQRGATAYNSQRWVRFTNRFKAEHPFCVNAGTEKDCTLVADVTDHVYPHHGDEQAFWAGPFQPMCNICHGRKTLVESRISDGAQRCE